ncbi:hypothetical protein G6011_10483 [Alternaria panax]|uniref:Xylanolytic transcriptional activator regulatory domain-containing protein n=1 Tax=Alternaria panax TaxID=48097 RepID=A0AAD4IBZ6_9PLEO|nr:hypothetical protein G6011_10483 [Alternaria panax]
MHLSDRPADNEGGYYANRRARLHENIATQQAFSLQAKTSPNLDHEDLPPTALRQALVELYFDYIHDQFHSMYHKALFMDDVINDRIPPMVLFAIFALAARFSADEFFNGTTPRERGEVYRVASERLFSIRELTPTTVQVCVLLGAYAAASGDTDVENLYYSMGGRLSLVLDLPNRPVTSLVEREVNIRTWWTLCMVDVWSSTAVRLPRIMPFDGAVPLPVDEIPFSIMSNDLRGHVSDHTLCISSPLLAEMVKLNRILARIIDFNRACVSEHLEGPLLERGIQELSRDLDVWLEEVPHHMRDTPANLEAFASRGLGRM